jgi:hydrogenase nickel incorporation protein HypA/HybF
MHELSLCASIAQVVLDHSGGRPVRAVNLTVGALRQVVPESLAFCWPMVSRQTGLDGAVLRIEQVEGIIECGECATRSTLSDFLLRCPVCGTGLVHVVAGEEFLVTSIEVDDKDDSTTASVPGPADKPDALPKE